MTAKTLAQPQQRQSPIPIAAWCMIAGAALTFILGFPLATFQAQIPLPWWIPTLNAFSHLLLLIGVIGLVRSGAAGQGRLATPGVWLTLLGLAALTVAEIISMIDMNTAIPFFSSATLIMMLGLILLGTAVIRARRWTGWHRFTPLLCGLFILLVMLPSFALPGLASNYAIGLWGLCWLLLGAALRRESTDAV